MKRSHTNDYEGRYFLTVPEVCSLFSYSLLAKKWISSALCEHLYSSKLRFFLMEMGLHTKCSDTAREEIMRFEAKSHVTLFVCSLDIHCSVFGKKPP